MPREAREVVAHHADPKELQRSLEVMSRRARAEFEDRGTHVLQLAWGLVHWQDDRAQETVRSPLLLIPCQISRDSVRDPWMLKPADDDPFLNPALRVKFQSDFGLQLPEYDDFDDLDLENLASQVQDALQAGWRVEPSAYVGIYGFAKEAMYRDLLDHIELVAGDSQVQTLALGEPAGETRDALSISVPGEAELDRVQDPAVALSVLDADSSQREAIEAAVAGLSFVMQGPPGTGKSQTIANIIAEFIGRGRSVLFVSEKIAALEVVANRLAEAGLEDLILELHSRKSSRREVASELGRVLDEDVIPNADLSPAELERLRTTRTQLNEYVQSLHLTRAPLGRSVRDVLAELSSLSHVPGLPGPAVDAKTATPQDLIAVEALIGRLAALWAPSQPGTDFVWHEAAHKRFGGAERDQTQRTLSRASEHWGRLREIEQAICSLLAIPVPVALPERAQLATLADLASHPAPVPASWLTQPDLSGVSALIDEWSIRSRRRAEITSSLSQAYGAAWTEIQPRQEASVAKVIDDLAGSLGVANLDSLDPLAKLPGSREGSRADTCAARQRDIAGRRAVTAPRAADSSSERRTP